MGNVKPCNNVIFQTGFGSFLERGSGLVYSSVNCETQKPSNPIPMMGALLIFSCDDIYRFVKQTEKYLSVSGHHVQCINHQNKCIRHFPTITWMNFY